MNWLNKLDDVLDSALRPSPPPRATAPTTTTTSTATAGGSISGSSRKYSTHDDGHNNDSGTGGTSSQQQQALPQQGEATTSTATTTTTTSATSTVPRLTATVVKATAAVQQQQTAPSSQSRAVEHSISTTPGRLKRGPTTSHHSNTAKTKRVVVGATTTRMVVSSSRVSAKRESSPPAMESEQQQQPTQPPAAAVPLAVAVAVGAPDNQPLLEEANDQTGTSTRVVQKLVEEPQNRSSPTSLSSIDEPKEDSGVRVIVDASSAIPLRTTATATPTSTMTPHAPPRSSPHVTPGLVRKKKKQSTTTATKKIKTISTAMLANHSSLSSSSPPPPSLLVHPEVSSKHRQQQDQQQQQQTLTIGQPTRQQQTTMSSSLSSVSSQNSNEYAKDSETSMRPDEDGGDDDGEKAMYADSAAAAAAATGQVQVVEEQKEEPMVSSSSSVSALAVTTRMAASIHEDSEPSADQTAERLHDVVVAPPTAGSSIASSSSSSARSATIMPSPVSTNFVLEKENSSSIAAGPQEGEEEEIFNGDDEEIFNGDDEEKDTSFVTIPLSDERGGGYSSTPRTTSCISAQGGEGAPNFYNISDPSDNRNQNNSASLLPVSGANSSDSQKSPIVAADRTVKDEEKGSSSQLIVLNRQEYAVESSFNLEEEAKPQSTYDGDHHDSDIAELSMSTAGRQVPVVQEDRILQVSSKSRELAGSSTLMLIVDDPNSAGPVTKDKHDPQIQADQVGKKQPQSRDPLLGGIESIRESQRPSLERTPSSVMRGDDLSSVSGVESSFQLFRSDFEVGRLLTTWDEETEQPHCPPWDTRMNCYGVVHVRVLRAQRLPCPVGSSIHAVVSLPPWKGMVRTRKAKSFAGSGRKRGVCTDWTETETSAISMVHAYSSNEGSPVPSIQVDLMMTTLGMFKFKISSLTLPCEALLRSPLAPRRNWFLTSVPQDSADSKHIPLLQIEALFEPDAKNLPLPSPLSTAIPMNIVSYDSRDSLSNSLRECADTEASTEENAVSTNLDDVVQSSQQSVDVAPSGPTPADDGSQQHSITVEHTESIHGKSIGSSTNSKAVPKPTETVSLLPANAMLEDDQSMADLSVSLQSLRRQESVASSANAHLLRLQTYYKPASCAVCNRSIMSVWRKKAYHCEACGVDCCSDCRLQIDVQLACGSEEARAAVEDAIQTKFTSDKILRLVAPIDESDAELEPAQSTYQLLGDHNEAGIGVLKIDILQAIVLANPLPPDSDAVDDADCLRSGDFYVRVSRNGAERNARTRTVQNSSGRPKFDAEEIRLCVPNYATEFRIEVVDASTDQPVGATLLTTHALLQEQRDLMTEGRLRPSSFGPFSFKSKRWVKTELRTGLKTGFGTDFFPDVKQGTSATAPQPGGIVGMIEVAVGLEEDFDALYGKSPYECPARAPGELDLNVIQEHIARLSYLVNDMKSVVSTYVYIISWENPFATALSLVLFVRFCFWYDPAHTGASSIFLLLMYMVYLAFIRFHGNIKHRFVERELSLYKKKAKVDQTQNALYRPVGLIRASVIRGKNLRSPELGLPGNAGCHVYLDLTRFMDSADAKELQLLDESVAAPHELGSTEHVYATNPTWKQLAESDEAKRLRQLLPTHGGFFEVATPKKQGDDELLEFPVLQPLDHTSQNTLIPWSSSTAAVVFEVNLYDVLQLLPGSEYSLGEVVVPLSTLAERGEISGWFKLNEPGKSEHLNAPNRADLEFDTDAPQLLLYLRWGPSQEFPQSPHETEREASIVIQEELVKSVSLHRQSNLGVVGSSIGAINSMRALSGHLLVVQNALGMVLDAIESIRNGFNFADPFKSSVLFALLSFVCLLLTIVPTKAIILTVGVLQYAVTFKSRFGRLLKMSRNEPTVKTMVAQSKDGEKSPVATWVMNAIRGLPTDVDLKRTYHWETRRLVAREVESQAEHKRASRLRRLWRAQWYATVQLVQVQGTSLELTPVFAMIQGHRFLWWRSVEDFDKGEGALGRIFLQGHAGLASPSPLEVKALRKEDLARLVGIFGRGADKQERLTLLCSSEEERDSFEKAISNALTTKND